MAHSGATSSRLSGQGNIFISPRGKRHCLVFMAFKMLIVVSSGGFRLDLAKKLAKEAAGLGAAAGIVFIGNSLYGLRRKAGAPLGGMEGVAVMAHEVGLAERGIVASEIAEGARIINDDELLELMIESERAMCF
jgi:hypothetical protein